MIGIAGVGMNAVAQVLHAHRFRVTGSDRLLDTREADTPSLPVVSALTRMGIACYPQDGSMLTPDTQAVVVSSAIEQDHPELNLARSYGIPVLHRAEALALATRGGRVIAVAGTSGKTTTTAMLGWLLTELGLAPNVVNGGVLLDWRTANEIGNVRITGSPWWVLEVDESDRSLLRFHPELALIGNVSRDHFSLEESVALFQAFADQVRQKVWCGTEARHACFNVRPPQTAQVMEVDEAQVSGVKLRLPGVHNQQNAAMAVAPCVALGYPAADAVRLLERFQGVERRLERIASGADEKDSSRVAVYDDYAHNPAKIEAACRAVQPARGRLFAVWRPHGFGPLSAMADELVLMGVRTFRAQDRFTVLPVYYAGGTAVRHLTAEAFVTRLQEAGVPAFYANRYEVLERELTDAVRPGDVVLCMGARDPELPLFCRRLSRTFAAH